MHTGRLFSGIEVPSRVSAPMRRGQLPRAAVRTLLFGLLLPLPTWAGQRHEIGLSDEAVVFSVIGDVPYSEQEIQVFQQHLDDHDLYSPAEFFVHLGDIKPAAAPCDEWYYASMAAQLRSLSVPAFVVPGDNEWTDCLDRVVAWQYWTEHLLGIEASFCGTPEVGRQAARPENFEFVHKGVLFVGINLVGGPVDRTLQNDDADWVGQAMADHGPETRAAVILAQAGPGSNHNTFFDRFVPVAEAYGKPIAYIHGDGHSWIQDMPFTAPNVVRVQVDRGTAPPVQVTVGIDGSFTFERDPWPQGTAPLDRPPCADAGPDRIVPENGLVTLDGKASDDGEPQELTVTWRQVSGPEPMVVADTTMASTTALAGEEGTYVLSLTASDGQTTVSDEVVIFVGAFGPNQAPLAQRDVFGTEVDNTLWVDAPGVLENDFDANGDVLSATPITLPQHGVLALDDDGSFTYVPHPGFVGLDRFVYRASDSVLDSDAEVWIGVGGDVRFFVAAADAKVRAVQPDKNYGNTEDLRVENGAFRSYLKFEITGVGSVRDALLRLQVTSSSVDGGSIHPVSNATVDPGVPWTETGITWNNAPPIESPALSTLANVSAGQTIEFQLHQAIRSAGTWSFALQNGSSDGVAFGSRESSTPPELVVAALPEGVTLPPVAGRDSFTTDEDVGLLVPAPGVLANDADEDGNPLSAVVATLPSHGSLFLAADGSFTYSPERDFFGEDAFSYLSEDGHGGSDLGIVTLTVRPVNDAPRTANDRFDLNRREPLTIAAPGVLANDHDVEGDSLTATLVSSPTHGSVTLMPDGGFVYEAGSSFDGTDFFVYAAHDGTAEAPGRVTIRWPKLQEGQQFFVPVEDDGARFDKLHGPVGSEGGASEASRSEDEGSRWIRFDVVGVEMPIAAALLRFPRVAWVEEERNAISLRIDVDHGSVSERSETLRVLPEQSVGAWVDLDVSSGVDGDGIYRFRFDPLPWDAAALPPEWPCLVVVTRTDTVEGDGSSGMEETHSPAPDGTTFLGRILPNPSRASVQIEYGLERGVEVQIDVYNARGQRLRTLVSAAQPAGRRSVRWDGMDGRGQGVPAGIYFIRARLGTLQETRKFLLVR